MITRVDFVPTLGSIPFLLIKLGERLYLRGLVSNPKFAVHKPEPKVERPEFES